jgi:hypothetical protein
MDILLTHGYFLYEDPKELQIMKPYPPLGILYICAHLRSKGLSVEVFDSTFSSRQQLFEVLRQGPPSVLGVYANLMTRSNVVEAGGTETPIPFTDLNRDSGRRCASAIVPRDRKREPLPAGVALESVPVSSPSCGAAHSNAVSDPTTDLEIPTDSKVSCHSKYYKLLTLI